MLTYAIMLDSLIVAYGNADRIKEIAKSQTKLFVSE